MRPPSALLYLTLTYRTEAYAPTFSAHEPVASFMTIGLPPAPFSTNALRTLYVSPAVKVSDAPLETCNVRLVAVNPPPNDTSALVAGKVRSRTLKPSVTVTALVLSMFSV